MSNEPGSRGKDALAALWRPQTIRARCAAIAAAVEDGRSEWFSVQRAALPDLAERVARLTRERFPDLRVPPHSRWRHFAAGGVDRAAELDARLATHAPDDALRARIDLTVVSVLLDAGAGPGWHYDETLPGADAAAVPPRHARSEGLAVASFRGFLDGLFSQHDDDPCRVDAGALARLDVGLLRQLFQVGPSNPMTGLEGRTALLRSLGALLESQARADGGPARPSRLLEPWLHDGAAVPVDAGELLTRLVRDWAPIWAHGSRVLGRPAGDVWPHRWAGAATDGTAGADPCTAGWVPFHKLSQWLTYSLLEPLQASGRTVVGTEALTGLPEYRNGGLLLDGGALVPRASADLARGWAVGDAFVVEWRALTVHLLDELARQVRERLGVDAQRLPLASILEGGTWAAGRQIAQERRGGTPPVQVHSEGTVF